MTRRAEMDCGMQLRCEKDRALKIMCTVVTAARKGEAALASAAVSAHGASAAPGRQKGSTVCCPYPVLCTPCCVLYVVLCDLYPVFGILCFICCVLSCVFGSTVYIVSWGLYLTTVLPRRAGREGFTSGALVRLVDPQGPALGAQAGEACLPLPGAPLVRAPLQHGAGAEERQARDLCLV